MKNPTDWAVGTIAGITLIVIGAIEASRQKVEPQTLVATYTLTAAQRVTNLDFLNSEGQLYRSKDHDFVRVQRPRTPSTVYTLRSSSTNVLHRAPIADVDGYLIIPVFRDSNPQAVEIVACRPGQGVPGECDVLLPGSRIDTLPSWEFPEDKRRAVRQ